MELERSIERLEKELAYLGEYETVIYRQLTEIQLHGSDQGSADRLLIQRLQEQLHKAQLLLANLL